MNIYVASSWSNPYQSHVVTQLRVAGHKVYDFKNPGTEAGGFKWEQIDPNWEAWAAKDYRFHLTNSPRCASGYISDLRAMEWADACVYVLPCGRSASLELGYMVGRGKRTIVAILDDQERPDLMFLAANYICLSMDEILEALS